MGCLPEGGTLEKRDRAETKKYKKEAAKNARMLATKVLKDGIKTDKNIHEIELPSQRGKIRITLENRTLFISTLDRNGFTEEIMHDTKCDGKVGRHHDENREMRGQKQINYEQLLRKINLQYDQEILQAHLNINIIHSLSDAALWEGTFVNHDSYNFGIGIYDIGFDLRDPEDGEMFCVSDNTREYCEYGIPDGFLESCSEIEDNKTCPEIDQRKLQADYSQALRGAFITYKAHQITGLI